MKNKEKKIALLKEKGIIFTLTNEYAARASFKQFEISKVEFKNNNSVITVDVYHPLTRKEYCIAQNCSLIEFCNGIDWKRHGL